ncbi:MAG: S41 family peptidase [bacterium]|nr:S41 family peptidase [bacterium]
MKSKFGLFFIFLLIFAQDGISQGSPKVDVKIIRVLDAIYDHHVQPRQIDAVFVEDFQELFFEAIDPIEIILTEEEAGIIRGMSDQLAGNFRLEGAAFVDSTYNLWSNGLERAKRILSKSRGQKLKMNAPVDSLLFQSFVSESQLEEKIAAYLKLQTVSEAMEAMTDVESYSEPQSFLDSAQINVYTEIDDYFKVLSNDRELFDEFFLNALANTFDPHTGYFNNAEYEDFKEELSSERELFGIAYKKNGKGEIEISSLMPGSSAWLSGEIHVGDIVLEIDFGSEKHALNGKTPYELGKLFESNDSKEITIKVKTAEGKEKKIQLFKTKVYSDGDNIKSAVLRGKKTVGYISLPDFYTNWESEQGLGCANDVAKAIVKLKKESVEGIILDLRNNGGGSLKEAVDLAGIFLNYGPILVTNEGGEKPYTIKDMNRGLIFSGPLVIMINGYSASASEVVAAALQDHNRAVIVGGKSYGKATGQSFIPLTTDGGSPMSEDAVFGQIKITNATLYRINLETNQARGVTPDIYLPISRRYEGNYEAQELTSLRLDSISKKMYYTPLGASPIPALTAQSELRINGDSIIIQILKSQDLINQKTEAFDPYSATLGEWVEFEKEMVDLNRQQDELIANYSVSFQPKPLQFDQELYDVDEVLKKYNDRFLERLQNDIDLNETYEILNQLIEN